MGLLFAQFVIFVKFVFPKNFLKRNSYKETLIKNLDLIADLKKERLLFWFQDVFQRISPGGLRKRHTGQYR